MVIRYSVLGRTDKDESTWNLCVPNLPVLGPSFSLLPVFPVSPGQSGAGQQLLGTGLALGCHPSCFCYFSARWKLMGFVSPLQISPSVHCFYEDIIKTQSCPIQRRLWWKSSSKLSFITPKALAVCLCASRSSLLCAWEIDVSWSALGVQGCTAKQGKTSNFAGKVRKLIIKSRSTENLEMREYFFVPLNSLECDLQQKVWH